MNDLQTGPEVGEEAPKAKGREKPWNVSVVWVVPVVAAIVAGYLVYDRVREYGPKVTIRFKDAGGLKAGQTPVKYRGVQIGEVTELVLSEDRQHALVKARLRRSAESVAREGTFFWIVRPEVGLGNISGLGTVITGPHVEVAPGAGKPRSEFVGLESAPVAFDRKGLKIILISARLGSLKVGSPVYYRGIEVGAVQNHRLGADATVVNIHVYIQRRYANLIRMGTKFWEVSGVDVRAGLFRGVEIDMESLSSLVAGGIAFATPNDPKDEPAKGDTVFRLYDKPEKGWLEWAPKIAIPPESP
jgi:paraquat-inducible protein B